jgi:hypothetical protein
MKYATVEDVITSFQRPINQQFRATPAVRSAAPPRVPARVHNLSPRNLSQDDLLDMVNANQEIALGTNHWTNIQMADSVVHPVTDKEMEYMALMKDPILKSLWKRGFGNEVGRLFQGICDIQGTNTRFFVEIKNIPKDRQITYGKIVCDYQYTKISQGTKWIYG